MKTLTTKPYWHFQKITWPKFAKFLIAANIVTIAVPWAIYAVSFTISTGESGWGYAFLLVALWGMGYVIAAVNIVAAIAYLFTHKSSRNAALLCVAAILLSAAYLLAILYPRIFG